jgi:hypothetical protein
VRRFHDEALMIRVSVANSLARLLRLVRGCTLNEQRRGLRTLAERPAPHLLVAEALYADM